jgi:hypothetical protein
MKKAGLWFILMACGFVGISHAATIMHKFVAIDEGKGNLLYVNEYDSTKNWIVPIGKSAPRDMQLIGKNRILIGYDGGYLEFGLDSGKILKTVSGFGGSTSARRLPNGHTLITGVNLAGATGVVIAEVDSANAILNKIVYPGDYCRIMRQTEANTYLIGRDTMIQEGDNTGTFIWKARIAGFSHAWKAVRLPSGNTLISGGYGAFMVEVDKSANIVRKFGDKASVPTAVSPYFYAMFQLLTNGDVVVANWQGHGDGHGASGIQMLEFNATGAIVWQWSKAAIISSLQGVLVLDSLNTNLLYDERNGVMEPLTTTSVSGGVRYGASGLCPYRIVPQSDGICIVPPTENPYSVSILNAAGMSVVRFSRRGTGFVPTTGRINASGVYLVRITDGCREFEQPVRIMR